MPRAALAVVALLAALAAALATAALLVLPADAPSAARVSLDAAPPELAPDTPIALSIPRFGVAIAELTLRETKLGIDGEITAESWVPVQLIPISGAGLDTTSHLRLTRADGSDPLELDGRYQLRLTLTAWTLSFPLPRETVSTREYSFTTLVTPHLRVPEGVVQLGYRRPLEIRWSVPVEEFSAEVVPPVDARSWLDPLRPDVGYVDLIGAEPGRLYEVQVTEARGANGTRLASPAGITVETASPPKPLGVTSTLEAGGRVALRWDRPIERVDYEIVPAVESAPELDPVDPRMSYIALRNPEQNTQYTLTITGGLGRSGAPITEAYKYTVATPAALEVEGFSPVDGAFGVALDSRITVSFASEIRDRAAAEAAITMEPSLPGHFEWPEPYRVQFVPRDRLPDLTKITVRLEAGPNRIRSVEGGFLESPVEFYFRTRPDKLIEVDLTQQRLVLFEGDAPIFVASVSTGVRGAETPIGDFLVDYKMETTRMRGVNPSGSRYDIPNVPWVLSFLGDYTIHGAPWRSRFGFPQSNGCVSLETGAAKMVYDWAPEGTPVKIHY